MTFSNTPRSLLPIAMIGALLFASSSTADEFKLTYDPFKNLGTKQASPADPANRDQVRAGAVIYVENCAGCHGAALEGAENWQDGTDDGTYLPPPHDDSGHTWHHSDKVLFEYVKLGGEELFKDYPDIISAMPGYGDQLTDEEIWATLAFIKDSWSEESRETQKTSSQYDPLPEEYYPPRLGISE